MAITVNQLSPAKLAYYNALIKLPDNDSAANLAYVNSLSDYQALASLAGNDLTPQERAIVNGTNGYAALDLLANKFGVSGPLTIGQGQTYSPTVTTQASLPQQTATTSPTSVGTSNASQNLKLVTDAYGSLGRTGIGSQPSQIDQGGLDFWVNALNSGQLTPADFNKNFYGAVGKYYTEKPTDAVTTYTAPVLQENAYKDILNQAYGSIGRTGFGTDVSNIDQGGYDFWLNAMKSGQYNTNGQFDPNKFLSNFNNAVSKYQVEFPENALTKYVSQFRPLTSVSSDLLLNPVKTPATTVGQFKELFPSFAESKRLAAETVANRPSMESIIAMLQGQGQQQTGAAMPATSATPSLANVLNMISK